MVSDSLSNLSTYYSLDEELRKLSSYDGEVLPSFYGFRREKDRSVIFTVERGTAIASTSMMSEMAIGMSLEDAYHLTPDMITSALGGLPEHKFHCSVLGDKALRAAIDDYLEKNGLPNPYKNSTAKILCECKGVTDVQIEELVKSGKCLTFEALSAETGCSTACGKCKNRIIEALEEFRHIYSK